MLLLPLFILFEPYALTISLFERALAAHNFLAFLSFFVQWRGLIGSRGIAPAAELMSRLRERGWTPQTRWRTMPTLAWLSASDRALWWMQVVGMAASAMAFFGVYTGWMIALACVCYSSIKCVGSIFTQLQMHAHIMEIDIIYVACSPFLHVAPSALVVLASLLNFRVMMGGGAGKWFGGDKSWRDGTAMAYHFWTMPLPNPLSPFFHRLPLWFHKMETHSSIVFESFCALFVFAPVYLRCIAFFGFMSLMLMINLTGNFAQIAVLTMNETLLLLNDDWWTAIFHAVGVVVPGMEYLRRWLLWTHSVPYADLALQPTQADFSAWNIGLALIPYVCFVLPYALIQLIPLIGTFRGHNALEFFGSWSTRPLQLYRDFKASERWKKRLEPYWLKLWAWMEKGYAYGTIFDLFSHYVKFGHMTKFRHEIIIEASLDGVDWQEYTFRYKPSKVTKRPIFWPVHLPAYDWRLWFLPLEAARGGEPPMWFMRSLQRLLDCEPDVMDLFLEVPFDGVRTPRPQYIRAVMYDYRFAYRYEEEDAMKALVKQYAVRDTEIDTESEEEVEVDIDEPTPRSAAVRNGSSVDTSSSAAPPETKVQDALDEKEATHSKKQAQLEREEGELERAEEESERRHVAARATVARRGSTARAASDGDESEDDDDGEASGGVGEDEQARRHRKAREALARLLGIDLPTPPRRRRRAAPGKRWQRVKKVTRPVAQYNEAGERIWYVRRHRVGFYGPTLAARKQASADSPKNADAWEGFLE